MTTRPQQRIVHLEVVSARFANLRPCSIEMPSTLLPAVLADYEKIIAPWEIKLTYRENPVGLFYLDGQHVGLRGVDFPDDLLTIVHREESFVVLKQRADGTGSRYSPIEYLLWYIISWPTENLDGWCCYLEYIEPGAGWKKAQQRLIRKAKMLQEYTQ